MNEFENGLGDLIEGVSFMKKIGANRIALNDEVFIYWTDSEVEDEKISQILNNEGHAENNEHEKVLSDAIKIYGKEAQIKKAIEELAELIVELSKPDSRALMKDLIDELADVKIMIKQIEMIFHLKDAVDYKIEQKVNRLKWNLDKLKKAGVTNDQADD